MTYPKNFIRTLLYPSLLSVAFLGVLRNSIASVAKDNGICAKLVQAGRLEKCIELAETTQPNSSFLAQLYYLVGHYTSAISATDKALQLAYNGTSASDEPSEAECFALKGLCNYKLGFYDKALTDFTNAINLPGCPPAVYQSRALVYEKLGDHKKALDDKEKAPNVSAYYIDLEYDQPQSFGVPLVEVPAKSDFDKGDHDKWNQAIKLIKDAEELENKDQLDQAVKKYQDAIVLYPNDPQFYAALGLCLTTRKSAGDQSEAIKAFKQAVSLDSHNWRLWNDLGTLLYEGNNENKKERVEERNKQYADAKHAFQIALSENKDPDPMQRAALLKYSNLADSIPQLSKQLKALE